MDNLELYIESLIFATSQAITLKEVQTTINEHFKAKIKDKEIKETLDRLSEKYKDDKYPFEIMEIAGGYQFMTKGTYYPIVSQLLRLESKKKLSKAALECLALVAYKQPLTKSGVESVRGVNCDHSIQKLLDKELIQISGRAEGPGRPLLYGTTHKFMDHFGLKSLNDLPKIKEFELPENEVGIHSDDLPDASRSADLEEIPIDRAPEATEETPPAAETEANLEESNQNETAESGKEVGEVIDETEEIKEAELDEMPSETDNEVTDNEVIAEEDTDDNKEVGEEVDEEVGEMVEVERTNEAPSINDENTDDTHEEKAPSVDERDAVTEQEESNVTEVTTEATTEHNDDSAVENQTASEDTPLHTLTDEEE